MITSGGGPGVWGLLAALRCLPGRTATVIVNDPAESPTLGTLLADQAVRLPDAARPEYTAALLDCCLQRRVDVLIPVYDGELELVARVRPALERAGTRVLQPPLEALQRCIRKDETYQALAGSDLVPTFAVVDTAEQLQLALPRLGYPQRRLCVKPVDRSGGRGVHVLDPDADDFVARMTSKAGLPVCTGEAFLALRRRGPGVWRLLVSEYLEGEELGFDVLAADGTLTECAVRRKSGPVLHGNPARIDFREQSGERAWIARVVRALRLSELVSIDARYDAAGRLKLLEVNARPGAYLGMTCRRVHLLGWAIDRLLGQERSPAEYRLDDQLQAGLRCFADLLAGPGDVQVLDPTPVTREAPPYARLVPRRTS
jgi:biotin carboxylase